MFTGLVEEVARVARIDVDGRRARLELRCPLIRADMRTGDSIAVDGCCLTAEALTAEGFVAFASAETLQRTTLGDRRAGDVVNVERALALGQRLGGHLVSGHIDGTGVLLRAEAREEAWEVSFSAPDSILRLCVPKGSIAVDGISLTIAALVDSGFTVWIIPETWRRTTLSQRAPGERVNLEADLLGKYVYRFLETRQREGESRDERLAQLLMQGGWGAR